MLQEQVKTVNSNEGNKEENKNQNNKSPSLPVNDKPIISSSTPTFHLQNEPNLSNSSNCSHSTEEQTGKKENSKPSHSNDLKPKMLLTQKRKRDKKKPTDLSNLANKKTPAKETTPLDLQLIYTKNILQLYPTKNFLEDLDKVSKNPLHQFMKENFPEMYSHNNFYNYIKFLEQKRQTHREIFIKNVVLQNTQNFFIGINKEEKQNESKERKEDVDMKKNVDDIDEEERNLLPKKVWSKPPFDFDYDLFETQCNQKWPFHRCFFVKEFALQYLMNKNYDMTECFKNIDEFVNFMKENNIKNDYPLVDDKAKIVKGYNLRIRNHTQK